MAAQPGKKPIAAVLRNQGFFTVLKVLLHRIPFDQTLLARTMHCESFGCKMEQAVVN
jgi:hypothetical protein